MGLTWKTRATTGVMGLTWKTRATTALVLSIEHWERMANGEPRGEEEPYAEHCACCEEFFGDPPRCRECPVKLRTGSTDCCGTPYYSAVNTFERAERRFEGASGFECPEFQAAAWREVEFLRETLRMVMDGEITPPGDDSGEVE